MNSTALYLVTPHADEPASPPHRGGTSHADRLAKALDAVERMPVLFEHRREFIEVAERQPAGRTKLSAIAGKDPALAGALLRFANLYGGGRARTPREALELLGTARSVAIARELPTYSSAGTNDGWVESVSRFRTHGLAVARVARRLARELGQSDAELAATVALFHDVGKLVTGLVRGGGGGASPVSATPADRVAHEVATFGVDHGTVGALVARRWSLPAPIGTAIEHHHRDDATGVAGIVRLADMLVHYAAGAPVRLADLNSAAQALGFEGSVVELPAGDDSLAAAETEATPCPLTPRQLELIRALGSGRQYKEIAADFGLSTSTVRSHMHCAYERLGVTDRAQAVLLAVSQGWINPLSVTERPSAA